jgi:hypothetical protein
MGVLQHNSQDAKGHPLCRYKSPNNILDTTRGSQFSFDYPAGFPVQLEMYFSLTFILSALPFLSAVNLPINYPASPGIAVPITKNSGLQNGVVDTAKLQSTIRHSVA